MAAFHVINLKENLCQNHPKIPPDLQAALDADQVARRYFEAFPRSAKRGILEWILNAKRPETRAKRIAETVRLAASKIRANQWRQQTALDPKKEQT